MTNNPSRVRFVCKASAAVASLSPVLIMPPRSITSYVKTGMSFLRNAGREDLFQRGEMVGDLAQATAA